MNLNIVAMFMNANRELSNVESREIQGTELIGAHVEGNVLVTDMKVLDWDKFNNYEESIKKQRSEFGIDESKVSELYSVEKISENNIIVRVQLEEMTDLMMRSVMSAS